MVDPTYMPVNRVSPLVSIEQVSADDAPLSAQASLEIGPEHTRFAFQYAGLSFVAPQKVRFRYKLDGVDRDWVDAGTRRTAYYTNIPPGRHIFRVMAANNDSVWSEQAAVLSFRCVLVSIKPIGLFIVVIGCCVACLCDLLLACFAMLSHASMQYSRSAIVLRGRFMTHWLRVCRRVCAVGSGCTVAELFRR